MLVKLVHILGLISEESDNTDIGRVILLTHKKDLGGKMESPICPQKKPFLCSSIRRLSPKCLQSNLLVPFAVATSDSPHPLTHAFLPVFCHTFNSDANSDYNFFHSLLPTYLRPFLPGPTSKTSLVWQQIQYHSSAYSKIGSAAKGGREKATRALFR